MNNKMMLGLYGCIEIDEVRVSEVKSLGGRFIAALRECGITCGITMVPIRYQYGITTVPIRCHYILNVYLISSRFKQICLSIGNLLLLPAPPTQPSPAQAQAPPRALLSVARPPASRALPVLDLLRLGLRHLGAAPAVPGIAEVARDPELVGPVQAPALGAGVAVTLLPARAFPLVRLIVVVVLLFILLVVVVIVVLHVQDGNQY